MDFNPRKILDNNIKHGYVLLQNRGYIKLPFGSYYLYIHQTWFNRLIKEELVHKNVHGMFVPVRKTILDLQRFDKEYEEWENTQRKTKQLKAQF